MSDETFPLTVAPKGGRARPATEWDATRASPDDSLGDTLHKAGRNFGDALEEAADNTIPWVRIPIVRELADYGVGYLQIFSNRRQKREDLVDAMREYNKRLHGKPGAFTENPVPTVIDGVLVSAFDQWALPTFGGLLKQRRDRQKREASSE